MAFINAYLTPKQLNLSRKTGVTRQTVNKAFGAIDTKVTKALLEGAKFNRIEISRLNMDKGFLLGRSMKFGLDALITFSDENGLQTWYKGEGNCSKCETVESCRKSLIKESEIRQITLPRNSEIEHPSQIADILFEKIMEDG
jgi:hypothetical protein